MLKFTIIYENFATYTLFLEAKAIEGFSIEQFHKESVYNVNIFGGDDSWTIAKFDSFEKAERLINEISLHMNLDRIVDVDKIKEEILNGENQESWNC